ncbi:MAG TPA: LLM class F420-dependent oxidoreductase [Steroidobacteraceae bacterium]|nr:LLM class F420-dependent oxidoreductase [Steroidobacteraceae bacterium]
MKINVPLPFDRTQDPEQFLTLAAVREVGAALERAGFHAGLVTDHPCPTGRWLDSGGHHAQSPFVMLALLAAVTSTLRLQTGILVLPYRNPFIAARDAATLDRYSNGRLTLSVGAGYLKGEYRALGVDFERRNELMDEYMRALKLSLTGEEFEFEGTGYKAHGNRILPGPVQKPHPPLLVGGNSRRAIRRVVELGDGWNPFFTAPSAGAGAAGAAGRGMSNTARTAPMETEEDLASGIAYLRECCEKLGRRDLPEVILGGITPPGHTGSSQQLVDRLSRFRELGASGAALNVDGRTRREWCDNAQRLGEDVIAKL